ncbi:unnamed protein product [Caenorhabditis angaria]|uniref:Major facilitator superfamily (MFS) profile domain-containing protein n=1 Tax=Caenorhabditis angaria TaxID=860376 RepID=A0A9P1IRK9_9PELO|nr:unnamed protein product [Caenorhabditis angaria]
MSDSNKLIAKNVQSFGETKSRSKSKSKSRSRSKSTFKSKSEESSDSSHLKHLDPDKFVNAYGTFGRYQMFTYILVQTLCFFYAASVYVMSYVQLHIKKECFYMNQTYPASSTCRIEAENNEQSFPNQECGQFEGSKLITYEHTSRTNLLMDFDLVCSHWFIKELGLSFFTIGAVLTVPFMSYFADRWGRRPILLFSTITAFIANLIASFSPNYVIFLILRTIIGAASDTYFSIASVVTCEFLAEKARPWITVVYNVAWALGMLWVLAVSQMTDSWKWRYFFSSLPGIYAFLLIFCLPESPHWLIIHNKTDRLKNTSKPQIE